MEERPIEALTDHRCVLGLLTRQLASADGTDRAALAGGSQRRQRQRQLQHRQLAIAIGQPIHGK